MEPTQKERDEIEMEISMLEHSIETAEARLEKLKDQQNAWEAKDFVRKMCGEPFDILAEWNKMFLGRK
jgi:FtsZ-binding cell division protein ZapB